LLAVMNAWWCKPYAQRVLWVYWLF